MQIKIKPEGTGKLVSAPVVREVGSQAMPVVTEGCLRRDQLVPAFEAEAYYRGKRVTINSKDYANKWLVIFFYSSDFTFV